MPVLGDIVLYRLNEVDATRVAQARQASTRRARALDPGGGVAYGNPVSGGDQFPMVVVRVNMGSVNGQVLLDGTDTLWVAAKQQGDNWGDWTPRF